MPKSLEENLRYRRKVIELGCGSKEWAKAFWIMGRRDHLWFFNSFGWTYNPKQHPSAPIRPMITWPFQDEALNTIKSCMGYEDLLMKKSRDVGASWMGMFEFGHTWLFEHNQAMGVMSRRAEEVDKSDNPKSLFWKIDFFLRKLPKWMKPDYTRTEMHLYNNETESSIDGETTTPDAFVGDRRLALWLDEFAVIKDGKRVDDATADVTNCRIFASTSRGTGTQFHRIGLNPNVRKLWLGWDRHPEKAAGLYVGEGEGVTILDKKYVFPVNYPFIKDGKKRSPWYDRECKRRSSKLAVAQEIDGDDLAAGGQWFDPEVLLRVQKEDCMEPVLIGDVVQSNGVPGDFEKASNGFLRMWRPLGVDGRPPEQYSYVFGVDWSAGAGASNSSVSIGCLELKEKIGEYTRSDLAPESFAAQVVALARFFREAYVCPERNGPGSIGIKKMQDLGYTRIYYARKEESDDRKEGNIPGWMPTNPNREYMLGLFRSALGGRRWTIRSEASVIEAQQYVRDAQGYPVHADVLHEDDPAGAKLQHGDRVVADGLCYLMAHDSVVEDEAGDDDKPPDLATFEGRRKAREQTEIEEELGAHWRP